MNIEDIFSEAAKIKTPADRAAYLDKVCAGDVDLRARLEALLAAHDRADSFLETAADHRPAVIDPHEAGPNVITTYRRRPTAQSPKAPAQ